MNNIIEKTYAIVTDSKGNQVDFVSVDGDGNPEHYSLKKGESLVFEDWDIARGMIAPKRVGTKWVETGEPPEPPPLPPPSAEKMLAALMRGYLGDVEEITEQQFEHIGRNIKAAEDAVVAVEQMRLIVEEHSQQISVSRGLPVSTAGDELNPIA